jgi:Flp pilus assembly pilin Flp
MRDDRGGSLVEYVLVLGAVALIGLAGVRAFGGTVLGKAGGQAACVASLDGSQCEPVAAAPQGGLSRPRPGAPPMLAPGLGEIVVAVTIGVTPPPETGPVLPKGKTGPGQNAKTPPEKGKPRPEVVQEIFDKLQRQDDWPLDELNAARKRGDFTDDEMGEALKRFYDDVLKKEGPKLDAAHREAARKEHERINKEHREKRFADQMEIARASAEEQRARDDLRKLNDELAWELSKAAVDVAGVADPTPISDGVSAAMSISDGDLVGAGLSLVSMVPYAGDALGKTAKGAKLIKKLNDLKDAVKAVTKRVEILEEATKRAMKKAKGADPPPAPAKVPAGGGGPPAPPPKKPTGGGGDDGGGPPKKPDDGDSGKPGGDGGKPDDAGGGPAKKKTSPPKRPRGEKDELTDIGRNKPSPLTETELKKMDVWVERRNYFLDKWHGKDLDGVDDATKKLVQDTKPDHAIRDHLTPDDIAGKMKESRGVEIKKGDKVMDHVGEVDNARDSVKKGIQGIQKRLSELKDAGDTSSKSYQVLVEKLKDYQHILDLTK